MEHNTSREGHSEKSPSSKGLLSYIFIKNDTPPALNLTIVKVSTKFFYDDGTTYTDTKQGLNIVAGDDTATESNDSSKCVPKAETTVYGVQPGSPQISGFAVSMNQPGNCELWKILSITGIEPVAELKTLSVSQSDSPERG